MKIVDDSPPVLTALDRPNSYIGRAVPRPNLTRLTEGRGQYVSDVTLPRMAHVAYVRSPHAHARIVSIATDTAKKAPGVIAVVTGAELDALDDAANQITGALAIAAWGFGCGFILFKVLDALMGLRVSAEEELKGLDITEHGMEGYNGFQIFANE